jgi:hypothetical protein
LSLAVAGRFAVFLLGWQEVLTRGVILKVSSLITVAISLLIIGVLLFPLAQGNITLGLFIALVSASFSLIQLMSWQLYSCSIGIPTAICGRTDETSITDSRLW